MDTRLPALQLQVVSYISVTSGSLLPTPSCVGIIPPCVKHVGSIYPPYLSGRGPYRPMETDSDSVKNKSEDVRK